MRIGRLSRLWPTPRRRAADDCLRCRTSFLFSRGHLTIAESPLLDPARYAIGALCDRCWSDLTPIERLPYYQRRWVERRGADPAENRIVWAAIEYAVKAGG